jgi:hypothetical protein
VQAAPKLHFALNAVQYQADAVWPDCGCQKVGRGAELWVRRRSPQATMIAA